MYIFGNNNFMHILSIIVYNGFDTISYFTVDVKNYKAAKHTFYVFMRCYHLIDGYGWGTCVM